MLLYKIIYMIFMRYRVFTTLYNSKLTLSSLHYVSEEG